MLRPLIVFVSYLVVIATWGILVSLLLVAIQLYGPYEEAKNFDGNFAVKVIKLDEGGKPYVTWCCRRERDRAVDFDRYLHALKSTQGVVESGHSHSRYSIEKKGSDGIRVILHNGGEEFVYDVRGAQIYPVKAKVLNTWKIVTALVLAAILIMMALRLIAKSGIKGASPRE